MIVHARSKEVFCIGQAAHAWVSGQLARRWGNDRFQRPEPFEDVCLGATQHDIGMARWDLRPTLDEETGYPQSFLDMDQNVHLDLWVKAPDLVISQSPYAALLVSMHGHALFVGKPDRPGVQDYLDDQRRYQQRLLDQLGETEDNAKTNQLLVWAVDYLALAALTGWTPADVPAPSHQLHCEEQAPLHLTVDPWPFDTPTITLAYDGRVLTQPSRTQEELDQRIAAAPWAKINVTWSGA
jgi:uncharacterized protein DUF3891